MLRRGVAWVTSLMLKSLRWRIQIWHALILGVVIAAFICVTYFQQSWSQRRQIDNELTSALLVILGKLETASETDAQNFLESRDHSTQKSSGKSISFLADELDVPATFAPRRLRVHSEAPYFVIWRSDGKLLHKSAEFVNSPFPKMTSQSLTTWIRNRGSIREVFGVGPEGCVVLVGRMVGPDYNDLRRLLLVLVLVGSCVFVLGLIGGWVVSGKAIEPITRISKAAASIHEHNLSQRIDSSAMDTEFVGLSTTLNGTFSRLESAFDRQRQFTADASHELRTPLSVIQMHQELALSKPRTPKEYQETLAVCARAGDRMGRLVDSLLALSRADSDNQQPRSTFEFSGLVVKSIESIKSLAEDRKTTIETDLHETEIVGNPDEISQVIDNLLSNALTYSPEGSRISISLLDNGNDAQLRVANSGVTIPSDSIEKIFDRFYRVDSHRSRDSGGSGLGLAICKSIIQGHGGEITAQSDDEIGTLLIVQLPRNTN